MDQYKPAPQVCPDASGKPMDMPSCISAFLVATLGVMTSLFLLFLECFTKKFEKSLHKILPVGFLNFFLDTPQVDIHSRKLTRKDLVSIIQHKTEQLEELKKEIGNHRPSSYYS